MKRIDLRKQYREQIESADWPAIVEECKGNMEIDYDGTKTGLSFLGTVFSIMPSGKYYMPWTTNQTFSDVVKDSVFMEMLEETAEKHGLYITSGEGDPCDVFAGYSEDVERG